MTIVATREGTSATIIDNVRDSFPAGFSWGQRLFFNQDGERASFTGERLSDYLSQNESPGESTRSPGKKGLNVVMIIQVPLKQKYPPIRETMFSEEAEMSAAESMATVQSDVENAIIGHGEIEGPFTEIDGLRIERDKRFPVRVTVQFYKATSNGKVNPQDMKEISTQIERVYSEADYVGSLLVDGPSKRPTEYEGSKEEPADWWYQVWNRFEENTGLSQQYARDLFRRLRFIAWRWFDIP